MKYILGIILMCVGLQGAWAQDNPSLKAWVGQKSKRRCYALEISPAIVEHGSNTFSYAAPALTWREQPCWVYRKDGCNAGTCISADGNIQRLCIGHWCLEGDQQPEGEKAHE